MVIMAMVMIVVVVMILTMTTNILHPIMLLTRYTALVKEVCNSQEISHSIAGPRWHDVLWQHVPHGENPAGTLSRSSVAGFNTF